MRKKYRKLPLGVIVLSRPVTYEEAYRRIRKILKKVPPRERYKYLIIPEKHSVLRKKLF